MIYDLIIIGAGAAGLSAAYHAINSKPQMNILVLEKENIPGRKLNATGNGKCNLTNKFFSIDSYHSHSMESVSAWVENHDIFEIKSFFENAGILLYEKNGYYYPLSNQAKQVSKLLYEKSRDYGVVYMFNTKVNQITKPSSHHSTYMVQVQTADGQTKQYHGKYIVLATGGYASPKLGGTKDGYQLSSQLGMHIQPIYPVLSPIYVKDAFLSYAKGVRMDCVVTMKWEDGSSFKETGQIQFNDNNLSGIVMMNLSCFYNKKIRENIQNKLFIDVSPNFSWDDLKNFLTAQKNNNPMENVYNLLSGILPSGFVVYLCKRLGISEKLNLENITEKHLNRLTSAIKKLEYIPTYVEDYDKAQVTGGGVCVNEISLDTFECKEHQNLYVVGELLDVHGKCGGYNLTFAILSGMQAINDIIHKETV